MTSPDTNVLFAWLNRGHAHHRAAATYVASQSENGGFVLCELVLVELYSLLRNDVLLARPLSAADATDVIQRLRHHPYWELVDYPGGLMENVWTAAAAPRYARRRILDARLALTLRHHGVTEFATANTKDFQDFGFSRVWNPLLAD